MNHQIRFNWDPSGDEVEMYEYYTPELRGIVFEASGLDALSAAARFWPTEPID